MKGYPMHIEFIYTGMSQKGLFNKTGIVLLIFYAKYQCQSRSKSLGREKKEHRLTHLTPYLMTSVNPTKALY